jgi:hypothetical protein
LPSSSSTCGGIVAVPLPEFPPIDFVADFLEVLVADVLVLLDAVFAVFGALAVFTGVFFGGVTDQALGCERS